MPLDQIDLHARLAVATPTHTVKGSLFRTVCAELQRMVPDSPERARLLAAHQKSAWQELASFPVADYLRLVYASAALLESAEGIFFSDALAHIGHQVSAAFLSSVVGRLAALMASGKDPISILAYAPATYAPTANYGKRTFERLGPDEAVFRLRDDLLPADYHLGVVRCGVALNGHSPEVRVKRLSLLDCDVTLRWRAGMTARPATLGARP